MRYLSMLVDVIRGFNLILGFSLNETGIGDAVLEVMRQVST